MSAALFVVYLLLGCGGGGTEVPTSPGFNQAIEIPASGSASPNVDGPASGGAPPPPVSQVAPIPAPVDVGGGGAEAGPVGAGGPTRVPASRLARLATGINLNNWLQDPSFSPGATAPYSEEDVRRIAQAGFKHVRLPFDPGVIVDPSDPARVREEGMRRLEQVIEMCLRHGLAVIVDQHTGDQKFLERLLKTEEGVRELEALWDTLSKRLADRDPEFVFFELMNETGWRDARRWNEIQDRLIRVVRRHAPSHTLVLGATGYADPEFLVASRPVEDRNVVYKFHFYGPNIFTHQGARWMGSPDFAQLRNVPYPLDEGNIEAALASPVASWMKNRIREEARAGWNLARMRMEMAALRNWSRAHDVFVICNEFGVLRDTVDRASRLAWLRDATTVFRESGFGWTLWEYCGDFGIVSWTPESRRIDPELLRALGL